MLLSNIIKKKFDAVLGRYDGNPALYYFSPKDFPELKYESFNIQGDKGLLKGFFYYIDQFNADKFIIFDHGIGAGHFAYLKEIMYLAKNGYTVYSYDHTGCVDSEGPGITGFGQGVCDLDHVITALKKDPRLNGKSIKLIGHSWGGYSSMNVARFHPEVTHIVSLAGFLSAKALSEQYMPKFVLKYSKEVMDRERQQNPNYADLDARESLKKTDAKLFYTQSKDDEMVKFDLATIPLKEALNNRANTTFVTMETRGHNPHYSDRAVAELAKMEAELDRLTKKNKLNTKEEQEKFKASWNWNLIREQDDEMWSKILDFLEN